LAGLFAHYRNLDEVMHLIPEDQEVPMSMLLLFIAEPAGMRDFGSGDIEKARTTLSWARFLWDTFHLPTEPRLRIFAEHDAALMAFAVPLVVLKMAMRAQSWQWDRRVVTRATIEIGPEGEWQLDVATT
jgi:hypothetical protein